MYVTGTRNNNHMTFKLGHKTHGLGMAIIGVSGALGGCDEVNNTYLAVLVTPDLLVGGSLAPGFKSPDPCRGEKHAVICCVGRVGKKYIPVCLE